MIYYLPLEYIDSRYTRDMDLILQKEMLNQGKDVTIIAPPDNEQVIKNKRDFLNSSGTNSFRFKQLACVADLFSEGKIRDGDIFFFSDIYAPGIEAIPYMAYFNNKKVKIMGILHAGSFTPSDFVHNLVEWSKPFEMSVLALADKVFIGSSQTASDLISQGYIEKYGKLIQTGIPISTNLMHNLVKPLRWNEKKDIVVFAGRLVDEKQPWLFNRLAKEYPQYTFIKTLDLDLTKKEYYELLSRSKLMVSFALQENYGIATIEAAAYGCNLLLPSRLSYLDFYPSKFLYKNDKELHLKFKQLIETDNSSDLKRIAEEHDQNVVKLVQELV